MECYTYRITNSKHLQIEYQAVPSEDSETGSFGHSIPPVYISLYKDWNQNSHLIFKSDPTYFEKIIDIFFNRVLAKMPASYIEEYLGKDIKFERIYFSDSDSPCYTLFFDNYSVTLSLPSWQKLYNSRVELLEKAQNLSVLRPKAHALGAVLYPFLQEKQDQLFSDSEKITGVTVDPKNRAEVLRLCLKYSTFFLIPN